ncbi:SDR family oxidoreductase [Halomonas sp. V046]|uniref:SDR family oxidoreductase n=1 Tax=Halomonas sp. V046 TaxID=3459611 RepID=UPI004043FB02
MTQLQGKTALVTGAAQGIGRAAVLRLAEAGARVIATDVNRQALEDLGTLPGVEIDHLDVLDPTSINGLAGKHEVIDVLFNCAGIVHSGTILECDESDLDMAYRLNVQSQYRLIRAVLPGMLARQDGSIINMASVASSVKGVANRFAYGVTKAAVIGLTKAVAADYITQGIRCNAICPGTVDSPSLRQRLEAQGDYEAARQAFVARQPMGRIGTPEEIAELVLYLAGATFTSGHIHIIDGGWTA